MNDTYILGEFNVKNIKLIRTTLWAEIRNELIVKSIFVLYNLIPIKNIYMQLLIRKNIWPWSLIKSGRVLHWSYIFSVIPGVPGLKNILEQKIYTLFSWLTLIKCVPVNIFRYNYIIIFTSVVTDLTQWAKTHEFDSLLTHFFIN